MNLDPPIIKSVLAVFCLVHLFSVSVDSDDKYSLEERSALEKFRPLVQNLLYRDYMKKDHYLIRWLRAKDLDIPKAKSMLEKATKWRKENKIDSILNETIQLPFPVTPIYHDVVSYSGSPVSINNVRAFQVREWILAGQKDEFVRFMDQGLELIEAAIQFLGERFPQIRQIILIFDFNGYNQRQQGCFSCLLLFQQWLRHYENYYPQVIKSAIVVNAPRIIKPLLNTLKPLLSPHSRKIITIFGQNKREWQTEIFKIVPRNQLRRDLGGTKPDHVPCPFKDIVCMCKEFFKSAGQVENNTISLSAGFKKIELLVKSTYKEA